MKNNKSIAIMLLAVMAVSVGCGNSSAVNSTPPPTVSANLPSEETPENAVNGTEAETPEYDTEALKEYMASVTEKSELIRSSLEQDPLNQYEMNSKSQELYELWDGALNYLWGEIGNTLPGDEYSRLYDEQFLWIAEKELSVKEVGKAFEGGSMYALTVNMEAANITEERVYELYEILLSRQ